MSSLDNDTRIKKLNDRNFQIWKFRIEMVLTKDDLWEIVEEEAPSPPSPDWIKKNRRAMATITIAVEDDQLIHIRKCSTAKEMWKSLKDIYERPNLNKKLFLLRKLYRMRLGPSQTMESHIKTMLEHVEQLRSLGEELKDNHLTAMLLCSVPESYGSLITALEARPENELTLDYVIAKLIDEDARRKENKGDHYESSDSVLKTKFNGSKARKSQKECYNCGKLGHFSRECREPRKDRNPRRTRDTRATIANRVHKDLEEEDPDENDHLCFCASSKDDIKGWFIDSGATNHMTGDKEFFKDLKLYQNGEKVKLADGNMIEAIGVGSGMLHNNSPTHKIKTIKLSNVLYVPKLEGNLLSVRKLAQTGYTVTFDKSGCIITKGEMGITTEDSDKSLYTLDFSNRALTAQTKEHIECIHGWHRRLGHRHPQAIKMLEREGLTSDLTIKSCGTLMSCKHCIEAKMTTKPFPKLSKHRSNKPYILLHSDLCGPMRTSTLGGKRYVLTITDDYSRYTESFLLEHKHQTSARIIEYLAKWNNVFGRKPRILRSDGGGEYINNTLNQYLIKEGIQRQITAPYSPQQNGISERKNRSLLEMTRCMLNDSQLGNAYWGEAILTATYLQNRLPHRSLQRTPYELWNGRKPTIGHLRVFGSKAYVKIPNEKLTKLDTRTKSGLLMGYSESTKGYRIRLDDTGKIIMSRDVIFLENEIKDTNTTQEATQDQIDQSEVMATLNEIKEEPTAKETTNEPQIAPRRSERVNKGIPAERLSLKATLENYSEPESWKEILRLNNYEQEKWKEAVKEEMKAFKTNDAWELVQLPKGKHVIGTKWTFKRKQDSKGDTIQYRARLVAKGYSQIEGVDYQDTYAPVVKYSTLRAMLTIASKRNMKTRHLDVKSAFLNGEINEELYMEQPEGQIKAGNEGLVCRLKKSIYGLKQAASNWNHRINGVLLEGGFIRGEADPCLYVKSDNGKLTYILLYVDDLLICSNNIDQIEQITKTLSNQFDMKDLGEISYYLGIHVETREDGKFLLKQSSKINALLGKYGLQNAKDTHCPMESDFLNGRDITDKPLEDKERYRQAVGAILHLGMVSRPDICAAVGFLGRKVSSPTQRDWEAVKKVLKYLKTTIEDGLLLGSNSDLVIEGYVDADWAGCHADRKSTTGYLFRLGESTISWGSKKQTCIALSSTEAEYVAAANACQELMWLKRLMKDMGLEQTLATTIHEDNQSCIKLVESEKHHSRTKHIDVKYHLLKHLNDEGEIILNYCPSEDMIADILTKPLGKIKHQHLKKMMGMFANVR